MSASRHMSNDFRIKFQGNDEILSFVMHTSQCHVRHRTGVMCARGTCKACSATQNI